MKNMVSIPQYASSPRNKCHAKISEHYYENFETFIFDKNTLLKSEDNAFMHRKA